MTETVACDLCGCTKSDRVLVGRDLWLKKPGEFQVVKCAGCGLCYLNPRPTREELAAFYPATYYSFRADEAKCEMNWRRRLSQRIKDRRDLAGLPRGEPGMKALDVGCGSGGFLATLQAYGWEAYGVEPFDGGRVAKERGLKVHHGTVEEAGYPEGNFQFIRLRHVLEHAPNPKQLMRSLAPILARDGLLQIILPNHGGLNARLFGKYWESLDLPRHLYHFRVRDVLRLAELSGLEVAKVGYRRNHFKSSLMYAINDRAPGWSRAISSPPLSWFVALIKTLISLFSRTSLGDEMTLLLRHRQ